MLNLTRSLRRLPTIRADLAAQLSSAAAHVYHQDEEEEPFRAHNFSPGPGMLATSVMKRAQAEFMDFRGTGMGVIETTNLDATGSSHPGIPRVPVQSMILDAETKLRAVLEIPDNYRVLFQHGGAVAQFSAVPLNLLGGNPAGCDIVDVGFWSQRATSEALKYCDTVHVPAVCENGIPDPATWDVRPEAAYCHITLNETVQGLEFTVDPTWNHVPPLVADATSTLLSRQMDIAQYGLIYASGGKNLPSGLAVVIIREDLLDRDAHPHCPQVLEYTMNGGGQPISSTFESMPNTPPVFPCWMLELILDDIIEQGGLGVIEARCAARADRFYNELIDGSGGFYTNPNLNSRSRMSVVFRIGDGDRALEQRFVEEAEAAGLHYLFGHPVKGGIRGTMYIGLPDAASDALAEFMVAFRQRYHVQ